MTAHRVSGVHECDVGVFDSTGEDIHQLSVNG